MYSFAISSADQEILNALTIADDIRKEFSSSSMLANTSNESFESRNSEQNASASGSSTDSQGNRSNDCDAFKLDAEFQAASQDIQAVYLMNDLFNERKNALEREITERTATSEEILSKSVLNKKLNSIKLVVKHITTIVNQVSRIKQVLQDESWRNTLKVSPFCQESVIQFFNTVDAIIKKMLEDSADTETNVTKVVPLNEMALHSKRQNIITGLARRLDILTEFRNKLSTAEDLESGIEMGNSESGKLEPQNLNFDQISTTDSGLNSLLNLE